MYRIYSILVLVSVFYSCSVKTSCRDFKIGRFYSHSDIDGSNTFVERSDSLQIEINPNTKDSLIAKVKWVDDCNYELTYLDYGTVQKVLIGRTIKLAIIKSTKDYYIYEGTLDFDGKILKQTDTLKIDRK